jgi:hypothetical protein
MSIASGAESMNRPAEASAVQALQTTREGEPTADETPPAARALHIEPTAGGRWAVCYEHGTRALSEHLTANDAKYHAKERARTEGIAGILVHDAYLRVHEVPDFHLSTQASGTP